MHTNYTHSKTYLFPLWIRWAFPISRGEVFWLISRRQFAYFITSYQIVIKEKNICGHYFLSLLGLIIFNLFSLVITNLHKFSLITTSIELYTNLIQTLLQIGVIACLKYRSRYSTVSVQTSMLSIGRSRLSIFYRYDDNKAAYLFKNFRR